jgi:hypothetical protein
VDNEEDVFDKVHNHHMLFHGTNPTNLLGILSTGLQIAPFTAQRHGSFLGDGIYFADKFSKAIAVLL